MATSSSGRWITDGLSAARRMPTGSHDRATLERLRREQTWCLTNRSAYTAV
jgi:hypothetical protein